MQDSGFSGQNVVINIIHEAFFMSLGISLFFASEAADKSMTLLK